jgi:hypothetical protein
MYEKTVTSRTKNLSAEARQRMEKLGPKLSSKLSSRAIADVMNQRSTKYDLPTGYMKQVRMILWALERSTVELMRDAREIEYVLEKLKALEAGGFAKETWKVCVCACVCVCVCACVFECVHVCRVCVFASVLVCLSVFVCMCACACVCACVCVCLCACMLVCLCVCVCAYACMIDPHVRWNAHTLTHIHTHSLSLYTHTHTHTLA